MRTRLSVISRHPHRIAVAAAVFVSNAPPAAGTCYRDNGATRHACALASDEIPKVDGVPLIPLGAETYYHRGRRRDETH
jgi:hypothetical protein